jgi:addiction module HigA family antidote
MIPSNRIATHPGVILLKEFLEPLGLTQKALATHVGIPVQRVNEIVRGKRGVSPDTAWLLAKSFNTSPEFWLNLQATHDLSRHRPAHQIRSLKERLAGVAVKVPGSGAVRHAKS